MLVRVVRAVIGTGLLLIGLPLLLAGAALWFAVQHQDPAGGYSAPLAPIRTDGYAVVTSDVDALLRREAPFARSGQTTIRLTARTETGPAFVGLAPAGDVARYLAGVPYTRVDGVRLARGPLPVEAAPVPGEEAPVGRPHEQPFWRASSAAGTLEWSPYELRGQRLALVVMDPDGRAPLTVDLAARVQPRWLGSTTLGLLVLGTVLMVVAVVTLAWPSRPREIVYVVPPAQVPEVAAQLGVPLPRPVTSQLAGTARPAGPPAAEPRPPAPAPPSPPAPPPVPDPPSPSPSPSPSPPASAPAVPVLEWPPSLTRQVTAPPVPVPAAAPEPDPATTA
jgi:hypothetical protein